MISKNTLQNLGFLLAIFLFAGLLILLEKPTGSFYGIVEDEYRRPIPHATLSADAYPVNREVVTDASGKFSLSGLPVKDYYLHVNAKGYQPYYFPGNQPIKEGENKNLGVITLKEKAPSLNLNVWDNTKSPKQKVVLSVSGAKIRQIHFTTYRVDLLKFLTSGGEIPDLNKEELDISKATGLEPVGDWTEEIPEADIPEFDKKFPAKLDEVGLYLIHAVASSLDRKLVFTRNVLVNKTNLGMVAKRDAERLLIYASRFVDPKPVDGAKVFILYGDGGRDESATNDSGSLDFALPTEASRLQPAPLIVATWEGSVAYLRAPDEILEDSSEEGMAEEGEALEGEEEGAAPPVSHKNDKIFLYTERPLYRPGQKVYFKGIARRQNVTGTYGLTGPLAVQVQVQNPRGDSIYEKTLNTNDYDSFWGELSLEEEAGLGYYSIIATVPGKEFRAEFSVEEYRKPEFKVEIKPDKPRYFAGEKITFLIDVQYYFGAPVEADLEYTLYKSYYYYSDSQTEGSSYNIHEDEYAGGYGEVVEEGKTKTDAQGHAVLSFKTKEGGTDQRYTLRVTAKDLTEKIVTREGDAFVVGGDFYFRTKRTEFIAFPNKPYSFLVVTKDYDGKPVSRAFRVSIEKERWDPMKSEYDYKKVDKVEGKTGADGLGKVEFTLKEGGYYRLALAGKDSTGRDVLYYDYLWAAGSSRDSESYAMAKAFTVVVEKKKYEAGETAKLLVVGPIKDGSALVTVEGPRILEYHVVKLDGFSKLVEIPLRKEWIPNIYFSVSAIGEKEFYEEITEVAINPSDNFLTVDIQPNSPTWQPGQDVSYLVTTKDKAGNPVPAELSLGVVDESIYALRADSTDIKGYFWGPRPNHVGSNYSFSGYFSGGIEKEDRNLLRRNFKDTAYWIPSVVTDASGQANVQFKLPDNLTTWRATVIAQTLTTEVGQQINKVISQKPIMVRLAVPRFFRERDQLTLKAVILNYTDQPQTLDVSLGLEGLDFKDAKDNQKRTLTIQPKQTVAFDFGVLPKVPGDAKLQLLAKNANYSDGVELKIPVLPHGFEEHQYQQGQIAAAQPGGQAEAKVELNLPPQTAPASSKVKVTLDTTLVAQLLGSLSYLVEYPYGCVEQTTSRILSAVTVSSLYNSLGLKDAMLENKIPKVIAKGIQRIIKMQHSDGGWGWWTTDDTDPYMTSYAMYGLLKIKTLGENIPEEVLKRGKESLQKQLKEGLPQKFQTSPYKRELPYFIHYVASLAGIPNKPPMPPGSPLPDSRMAQALLILTLEAQGKHEQAAPLLADLIRAAICQGGLCHFSDGKNNYRGDGEVTAWALQAILVGGSEDQVLKDSIVKWLFKARRGGMWRHTQETSAVLNALTSYAKDLPFAKAGVYAKLLLNGEDLETVRVSSPHFVRNLNKPKLNEGNNFLTIVNFLQNTLYYQTDLQYFTQEENLAASTTGLKVKREYLRLKPGEEDMNGEKTYKASDLKGKIAKGEVIGVRLTIENAEDLAYVVMEDPLPSGFEVMEGIRFDQNSVYYADITIRDELVALFATYLDKGVHVFNYALRPELAGDFHVMPTECYEMYRPEVKGNGAEARLEVQ